MGDATDNPRNYFTEVVSSGLSPTDFRASISSTIIIITGLSFLGILAHDEFYIFIIIASSAIVLFCPRSAQFPFNPSVLPISLRFSVRLSLLS